METTLEAAGDTHTAGVKARPPKLFGGALLAGLVLDYLLPLPVAFPVGFEARWTVGGALSLIGVTVFLAAVRNFSRVGTPVPTIQPTRARATDGIHGWSRNPIYLGLFLTYGGIATAVQSAWMLVLLLPIAFIMRYGVVAREEAYLERRFGDAYRDCKRRVRRWV